MSSLKIKILLVEDSRIAQTLALAILEDLPCSVDVASTGQQALERVHEQAYDLIFMDLGLPDTHGCVVTEMIRKTEQPNTHTPIIALTAHGEESEKEACFKAGMNDFIQKPLSAEVAEQIIQGILNLKNR